MKKFMFFCVSVLVLAGTTFANNPAEALDNLIDAIYERDSGVIINSLTDESVAMLDMVLMMVKAQPEEVAIELSEEIGIEITPEEVISMTAADFIELFILSPDFIAELPSRNDISVSDYEIEGDYATVSVSLEGEVETVDVLMLKVGDTWKIAHSLLESAMMQ